jgi:hypothetical protein
MKLQRQFLWHSALSRNEIVTFLKEEVEEVERFRLISKISGAGIVTRVLSAPDTKCAFWGKTIGDNLRIVQNLPSVNLTPFQPIVYLDIVQKNDGSDIKVLLKPHSNASMFSFAEYLGGTLCITAGMVALQQNPLGISGIILGGLVILFPRWRAKKSFELEASRCIEAIKKLLAGVGITSDEL